MILFISLNIINNEDKGTKYFVISNDFSTFVHVTVNLSKSKEQRAWLIIRSVTRFSEHQKLYLK